MILCSTIRKLAAKQAAIYKLTRHPVVMCGRSLGGTVEYFATMNQARKAEGEWLGCTTVTTEIASMEAHYMRT